MECLQTLLDSSTTPALTAFLLGLLTAVSPCPLATNIAAIGFIGRDIENRHRVFLNGLLYTLGRVIAYTALGVALILILREGANLFGVQKFIGKYGELVLGPVLLLIGLFMLFGSKLKLPSFGFNGSGEGLARKGGLGAFLLGMLFAMAFCPTSGVFYFGMLIPMSATASAGYLLPVLFAVATALPVLVVAWMLAFSVQRIGSFYGRMQTIQKWLNRIVGWVFMGVGIYYCIMEIKVLGTGCAKCKATYQVIKKVIDENKLDATLTKVEDIVEILNAGVMATPAVLVDGAVKVKGHIPSESEVKQMLGI